METVQESSALDRPYGVFGPERVNLYGNTSLKCKTHFEKKIVNSNSIILSKDKYICHCRDK